MSSSVDTTTTLINQIHTNRSFPSWYYGAIPALSACKLWGAAGNDIVKRGYDVKLFEEVLYLLVEEKPLLAKHLDHSLAGNYRGHRECHITSDWLLIYKVDKDILTLSLTRTGTHSDLFWSSGYFSAMQEPSPSYSYDLHQSALVSLP